MCLLAVARSLLRKTAHTRSFLDVLRVLYLIFFLLSIISIANSGLPWYLFDISAYSCEHAMILCSWCALRLLSPEQHAKLRFYLQSRLLPPERHTHLSFYGAVPFTPARAAYSSVLLWAVPFTPARAAYSSAPFMGSPVYSRQSGILMQRGPPRPRESSAEEISCTTIPLSRRMPFVT